MQGTAIVFGHGDTSVALADFPPSADVLQDSFVAEFTGPEVPSPAESRISQGNHEADAQARTEMAQAALRKEIQMHGWDPKYWSKARPTEFCYGDCGWSTTQVLPTVQSLVF